MRYLRDSDKQALRLAGDLDKAIRQWLSRQGVDGSCTISPYVDQTGQPAVLITMGSSVANAMITGLNEGQTPGGPGQPPRETP